MTGRSLALLVCGTLLSLGCSEELGTESTAPIISGISSDAVVVGETLEFFGRNLAEEQATEFGDIKLRFRGQFVHQNNTETDVDFEVTPSINREAGEDGRDVLTWRRVGPFANPFTNDASTGFFRGTVMIVQQDQDGNLVTGDETELELKVEPSIIIESFEPLDAQCGAPALRALAGMAYQMRIRVAGFSATRVKYEFSSINANPGVTVIDHSFGEGNPVAEDVVGDGVISREIVYFNPVPENLQYYVAGIRVTAYNDQGEMIETALPMTIHRPVEVRYGGKYELAEVYEPEPVTGCTPGTIGATVQYEERQSETRQQSVNVTVSSNWRRSSGRTISEQLREGVSIGESNSQRRGGAEWEGESSSDSYGVTYARDEANDVSFSTQDGESWNWSIREGETEEDYRSRMDRTFGEGSLSGTVGATGEGSIPGFAKVTGSVETTTGVTAGSSVAGTEGERRRVSVDSGYGMAGSSSERRAFGSTTGESQSESLSGSYALTNARERSFSDTDSRSESRVWNLSEGQAVNETVSEGNTEVESRTWVTSETLSESQAISGRIPRNKVGIFYRQTSRWVKRAEVRTYDLCGLAHHAGEIQFNEWTWAAELAIGDGCDVEPPVSELPRAQCYISPCGG